MFVIWVSTFASICAMDTAIKGQAPEGPGLCITTHVEIRRCLSFSRTTMGGCCGEPVKADDLKNSQNAPSVYPQGTVTSQPNGQPQLQQPLGFQQPSIAAPPAMYGHPGQQQLPQQHSGLMQQQQPWNTGSPPPQPAMMQQQFTGYSSPHSPPPPSMFGADTAVDSIMRPPSAFNSQDHSNTTMSMTPPLPMLPPGFAQKAADEGRMSISIDFGERFQMLGRELLVDASVVRYNVLRCCTTFIDLLHP